MAGQKPHITKVLWIFMENRSFGSRRAEIPGGSSDPYIRRTLIRHCGSTTNYHAVTHPSLPNYLAATSGSTHGVAFDERRSYDVPNIFGQVGRSWRSYQEFMPVNCDRASQVGDRATGHYYVGRHNPAAWYSSQPVRRDCARFDVPLGTAASGALVRAVRSGGLPSFTFVTPGLCDDMHLLPPGVPGCPNATAVDDAWLARWIPVLTSGPDYAKGRLVIDITWDEGSGGGATNGAHCVASDAVNCVVSDIVISPYTRHVVSAGTSRTTRCSR